MLLLKRSPDTHLLKYALSLPLAVALLLACENVKEMDAHPENYQGKTLDEGVVVGYETTGEPGAENGTSLAADPKIYESKPSTQEVFKVVEQMPVYGDCDQLAGKELWNCSTKNLMMDVYQAITYPEAARKEEVEGTSVVQLVVSKEGQISDVKIVRPLHPAIDMEVYQLINNLPGKWRPGVQRGKTVNVQLVLPIRFKLEAEAE